jgi:hypothetical protein
MNQGKYTLAKEFYLDMLRMFKRLLNNLGQGKTLRRQISELE